MKNENLDMKIKEIKKFFQSPDFMLEEEFLLEFNSSGELTIKGCDDIKEYGDDCILLVAEEFIISVKGQDLYIKQFSLKSTIICGQIESINFTKSKKENL